MSYFAQNSLLHACLLLLAVELQSTECSMLRSALILSCTTSATRYGIPRIPLAFMHEPGHMGDERGCRSLLAINALNRALL